MKLTTAILALLLLPACAKIHYRSPKLTGAVGASSNPARELSDLGRERDVLVHYLKSEYLLDVAGLPSRGSCCGAAWGRYTNANLNDIERILARILTISRRQAVLTQSEFKRDDGAVRTRILRDELIRRANERSPSILFAN